MFGKQEYRRLVLFVTLYVLFSLPPFLLLNWQIVMDIYERIAPLGVVAIGGLVAGVGALLYVVTLADEGVERYVQFVVDPSDLSSVLVAWTFLWAAISWWAIPELLFQLDVDPTLNMLLVGILASQIPMVMFLSLLTAAGKAKKQSV